MTRVRVGVFGHPEEPDVVAALHGLARAGFQPVPRNPDRFQSSQVEPFGFVVVSGARAPRAAVIEAYRQVDIPVAVIDCGYINRHAPGDDPEVGHWQLGLGGLNAVPPFACPGDRLEALPLHLADPIDTSCRPFTALIAGQLPGDAAHGLDAPDLIKVYDELVDQLRCAGYAPIFRPHPANSGNAIPSVVLQATGALDRWLERAVMVVTISSNLGHEALARGVPVACRRHRAAYGEIALDLDGITPAAMLAPVDTVQRAAYFTRLAYGQWRLSELRSGAPFAFVWEAIQRGFHSWKKPPTAS